MNQELENTQENRVVEGNLLVMDIVALPTSYGLNVEKWAHLIKEQGVLFYDSAKGEKPFFTKPDENIQMYDVRDEKVMKDLEEILKEPELPFPEENAEVESQEGTTND